MIIRKEKFQSIVFFINTSFITIVLLLLLSSGIAIVGTNHLADGLKFVSSQAVGVRNSMTAAIATLRNMTSQVDDLAQTTKMLAKLGKLNQSLQQGTKTIGLINSKLDTLEISAAQQRDGIQTLGNTSKAIANNLTLVTGRIEEMLRSSEDINQKMLESYVGYFQLLNGEAETLSKIKSNVQIIFKRIVTITGTLHKVQGSPGDFKLLIALKHELRPYLSDLRKLSKLENSKSDPALRTKIVDRGQRLIVLSSQIQANTWKIANRLTNNASTMATSAMSNSQLQVSNAEKSYQTLKRSLLLIRTSNKNMKELTSNLRQS